MNEEIIKCLKADKEKIDYYVDRCEQLEKVLDEIREFTDNHIMLIYTKNAPRKMVGMKDILQILDKVKE